MKEPIKVPYYSKENWEKLQLISLDSIPGTYESYINDMEKGLIEFNSENREIIRIEVDLDDMNKFLVLNNLPNISENRSYYIHSKIN